MAASGGYGERLSLSVFIGHCSMNMVFIRINFQKTEENNFLENLVENFGIKRILENSVTGQGCSSFSPQPRDP